LLPAVESIRLSWSISSLLQTQAVPWRSDGKVQELSRVSVGKYWPQTMLGMVMVAASTVVLRFYDYDGHDFIYSVWAPTRALLSGVNPYDPAEAEYFVRYPVPIVGGLYTPTALLLHAPLAFFTPPVVADIVAVLNVALVWAAVLLLIPPNTAARCALAASAGVLLVLSSSVDHIVELGQLSGWAFFGLSLFVYSLRRDPPSVWLATVGVVLVALKPQSGIPLLAGLMVLRQWKVLVAAVVALCLTSLPGTLLLIFVTGSLPAMLRILPENAAFMSSLPPGDLSRPDNLRIDLLGILSHLNIYAFVWPPWTLVAFLLATGAFFVVLCAYRNKPDAAEPVTATLLSLLIVMSLYHLTYDQILLYVGPTSALPYVVETGPPRRSTRLLAAGGIVLFGMGLLFRPGVREQLVIRLGLPAPLVHHVWVAAPTVFTLMLVGGAIALRDRRRRGRLADGQVQAACPL
jgi:hypothetical protein